MERSYAVLPSHLMEPETTFQQPVLPEPKRVRLDDPALEVMTDFRRVRAITVAPDAQMDYARQRVRGLFAVSQLNRQLGSALQPVEVARNFAEVETALASA
jgi:hypothetical protein